MLKRIFVREIEEGGMAVIYCGESFGCLKILICCYLAPDDQNAAGLKRIWLGEAGICARRTY